MAVRCQIDAWDPVAAAAVTLRAGSADDPAVCHVGGQTWWPALAKLPTLRYDLFDGSFEAQISAPTSNLSLRTEPWPNIGRYSMADARLQLWTGGPDAPGGAWTLRLDGRVTEQPKIAEGEADTPFGVDDKWLDTALLTLYAGTTGAEGGADLKGQPKPLAIGAPRYVPGKLIDSVNSVYQVSGYGSVHAINVALDKLVRFSAAVADYPSYAALVAATIPAGSWATAKAVGMARFGAPPYGLVSFLMEGDDGTADGWIRKPGEIIRRLALLSGGAGKIDDASLDALDISRPYNLSLYLDQQTTARQLIQGLAASVNAVAGVSWLGKLFVVPIDAPSSPSVTLAADGTSLPMVSKVEQIGVAAPFRKLAIGAERTWAVHSFSDIAYTAPIVELGPYDDTLTYRDGNIVEMPDKSRWLYIWPTPTAGNDPVIGSTYWRFLSSGSITLFTSTTAPVANAIDDLWTNPVTGAVLRWGGVAWEPISDITSLNQHALGDAPDVHVTASNAGTIDAGQLPRQGSIARLLGATDVSDLTTYSISATGGVTITIDSTGDPFPGTFEIASQPLPGETTVTVLTDYFGVPLTKVFKILRDDAPPPAGGGGGGGGGGGAGPPASTNSFAAPGLSGSYVLLATIPDVTTGTGGTVDVSAPVNFNVQNSQGSIDPSSTDPVDTFLDLLVEYTTNGGSSWSTASGGPDYQTGGQKYYQIVVPKGAVTVPGSTSATRSITGLGTGTTVGVRIKGVASGSSQGINAVYGSATATPS